MTNVVTNKEGITEMHRAKVGEALTAITLTATVIVTFTNVIPTAEQRFDAINAAQARIVAATRRGDKTEIEKDAAIIAANLAGLIVI